MQKYGFFTDNWQKISFTNITICCYIYQNSIQIKLKLNLTVMKKKFTCGNFQPTPCPFTAEGTEAEVTEIAADHVIAEHGFMDSVQLREDIQNSLTDE